MAFLGLMWVREHEAVVAALKATHNEQRTHWRKEASSLRKRFLGMFREKSWALQDATALRAELATLKAERDKVIAGLNAQLTAEIRATQLYARQVLELTPHAEKYRERLRRDREASAAKRKRAVAALPNEQAARGEVA